MWRDAVFDVDDGAVRVVPEASSSALPRLDGVVTGAFTDSHVHLQLVDERMLQHSALGTVVDLGGSPDVVRSIRDRFGVDSASPRHDAEAGSAVHGVRVAFAGAFLTPPGGYPSDRTWAPEGSTREIADADAAASAIAEMKLSGASCIKVASNSTAGPVFSDELFSTIVEIASSHGLSVIAHAEGPGEAMRATRLRARLLAHAPFTERLTDDELSRMHGSIAWISTLAIHDGDAHRIAVDNVRRFHALGGIILYGTDMGNGDTPVGLSHREIAALRESGIDGAALLRSLVPGDPATPAARLLFYPGATPTTADPLRARLMTPDDLKA
ncbi:hypothetical protein [Microbacterium sp.]|uniref:hypothetical protein n=1 Tax=Microbacterium sp. TaxID=51671 RepID=UPI0039E6202D